MKCTLIGGPNHGEVVELSDGVEVYEGTYRKTVADYLVHESLTELGEHEDVDGKINVDYVDVNIELMRCDSFEQVNVIKSCSTVIGLVIKVRNSLMNTSLDDHSQEWSIVRYIDRSILRD